MKAEMAPYPKEKKKKPVVANWNDLFKLEMAEQFMAQTAHRNLYWIPVPPHIALGLKGES